MHYVWFALRVVWVWCFYTFQIYDFGNQSGTLLYIVFFILFFFLKVHDVATQSIDDPSRQKERENESSKQARKQASSQATVKAPLRASLNVSVDPKARRNLRA
jgi:hypothetical protein